MNATARDGRTMLRTAAMLGALAVLAERAASRSLPVRWVVLCILRWAEAAAHAFVVEATQANWPCLDELPETENRPVDAAWLAWRFRMFAAVLGALVRLACRRNRWSADWNWAALRLPSRSILIACGGSMRVPDDTS